jgi:hypothetical protein
MDIREITNKTDTVMSEKLKPLLKLWIASPSSLRDTIKKIVVAQSISTIKGPNGGAPISTRNIMKVGDCL